MRTKINIFIFSLITALFFSIQLSAAERDLTIDPLAVGPYGVGSTNFTISDTILAEKTSMGLDLNQYLQGTNLNGEMLYISDLLAYPQDSFSFQLEVPNDSSLYGDSAGTTLPYAGYVFYPTTESNERQNYAAWPDDSGNYVILPRMQGAGEAPIFADEGYKYPLIVTSHGLGDWPGPETTLASHGYIVLALFHGDYRVTENTDIAALLDEPRIFTLRPLSVKAAIDELIAHPDFADHIDIDRIGGVGGSLGGWTMLALLGAKSQLSALSNTLVTTTVDLRIKAAAGIVPYFGKSSNSMFGQDSTGTITVDRPFLANSGNADETADYSIVQNGMNSIPGVKYLVEYEGEPHLLSEGAFSDAYTWTKVFLDAFIKEDASAIDTLSRLQSVNGGGVDSLVLVTEPNSGTGEDCATYNPATERIHIPTIDVGALETFEVTLDLPYYIVNLITSNSSGCEDASYNVSTGEVHIPTIDAGALGKFDVRLSPPYDIVELIPK